MKTKFPEIAKFAIWTSMLAAILLACSYCGAYFVVSKTKHPVAWSAPPVMLDAETGATSLRSGHPALITVSVVREPMGCWVKHFYQLKSEAIIYQFPNIVSGIFSNTEVMHIHIANLVQMPVGLPAGDYELSDVVYPTCQGVDVQPYILEGGRVTVGN